MSALGLLILRLVLGVTFVGHGSQKLFGWFGGSGLKGTIGWIGKMGLKPASFWGLIAALSEFGGGLLAALGLFNPVGSLGIIAAMGMAILKVHWPKGFWNTKGGIEFPLMNVAAALAIALLGAGTFSLDALFGIHLPEPLTIIAGLILVILGTVAALYSPKMRSLETAQRGA